jgi:hypothetical protein
MIPKPPFDAGDVSEDRPQPQTGTFREATPLGR